MIAVLGHPAMAAGFAILWGALACFWPLLPRQWHHHGFWTLVLGGVPVLGWLTYLWGPAFGVLFLGLGLSLLVWPPLAGLRRRRAPARRGVN